MNRAIAILGAAESGIGAAILAKKLGLEVFLSDSGAISDARKAILHQHEIAFEEGGHSTSTILAADLVVKSPGIPDKAPFIQSIVAQGISVISEIEFAFRYMEKDAKVIAITGTNGKTTTTLLTYHLLKSAGLKVALGGNVGVSLAKLVAEGGYDYYVVEVSSFQLDGIVQFKPDIAVLLNITPDHLDRYNYDFQSYVSSKFRITENLTSDECFIYCADSKPITEEISKRKIEACLFAVSATKGPKWQAHIDNEHLIFDYKFKEKGRKHQIPVSEISLIGKHNMINSMSAVLCALTLDVPIESILKSLKSFINAPHRLELAGKIDGVKYINDSKATNVDSVFYALDGINEPIIWIAGGTDKGNDYSQIADLVRDKVKALICLGVDNSPLRMAFDGMVENIVEVDSAAKAVSAAHDFATKGDVVLLSPACASFDLFTNYEDRGDQFKAAVKLFSGSKALKA
ncbi:MAG: UDP-N-acetylmuramoylalanine--D-glutamate ligase [Cyclobacteriaceae bacterium]|jgi:UDP-N-acetylmuramoylalanine--D-glutamate ligase